MKATIGDLLAATPFDRADFAIMQSVFDQTCKDRSVRNPERRAQIAMGILKAYTEGERDRFKLLDAAMAAAL